MRLPTRFLYIILSVLFILVCSVHAEKLTGKVTDSTGAPIPKVTVNIPALDRATMTDDGGIYVFERLPHGVYTVSFSSVGFATAIKSVEVLTDSVMQDVSLHSRILELKGVSVSSSPQPTDALYSPQSVTIVGGRELQQRRGETVVETIANTPGVTMYTTGTNISKPVIRGLTSQRVLVVNDGVRQEGQQWGDEHGTEIDPLDIESIEVVRGPGSLLYGSDALGGVVSVTTKEAPSTKEGSPALAGQLVGNGFTGNSQEAGAASLFGAYKEVGYRGNLSLRNAGDTRTPSETIPNSGEKQTDASGAFGIHTDKVAMDIDYHHFYQHLEISEDPEEEPGGGTGNQKVNHDRFHLHAVMPTKSLRYEFNGGWQRNQRREFEEKDAADPALYLDLKTFTADLKAHHQTKGNISGTFGASLMSQKNESKADEKLIPEFDNTNAAGFLYEQYAKDKVTVSGGLRYDHRNLDIKQTEGEEGFLVEAQALNYDAVTGTAGLVYRVAQDAALAFNVGRAWRAPTPFELFINGVHEGTNRYEVGDDKLVPEKSLTLDASFRVSSQRIQGEVSLFLNRITDLIFINPTGVDDSASGLAIYQDEQADATLKGGEVSVQVAATNWLIFSGGLNLVRGDNDVTNSPLPLMPGDRIKGGVKFIGTQFGTSVLNPYAELEVIGVAKQDRIADFEEESAGYGLVNTAAGFELPVGGERVTIDLGVNNLFDKKYRDHLSRYKEYADNPGISAFLKVAVPFTLAK